MTTPMDKTASLVSDVLATAAALEEFADIDEAEGGNPHVIETERKAAQLLRSLSSDSVSDGSKGVIERFEPFANEDDGEFNGMGAVPDGEWVRYSDHIATLDSGTGGQQPVASELSAHIWPTRRGFKHPDGGHRMLRLWVGRTSKGQEFGLLSFGMYCSIKMQGFDYTPVDTDALDLVPSGIHERIEAVNALMKGTPIPLYPSPTESKTGVAGNEMASALPIKARALLDSVTLDSDGIMVGMVRQGGNGGLISIGTIRAADELRQALDALEQGT